MSHHQNTKKFRAEMFVLITGLALAGQANAAALLGPLVQISTPDPFAACGSHHGYLPAPDAAAEPMLAVNPANTANMVAVWCAHGMSGVASSTTFDGGVTWLNQPLPGNGCGAGADPWVSFGPTGAAFAVQGDFSTSIPYPAWSSPDGGVTWNTMTVVPSTDRPSITCDPYDARYVYMASAFLNGSFGKLNNCAAIFQCSTNGGQTWQPAMNIHSASGTDFVESPEIVVQPDGTLVYTFSEGSFQNNHTATISIMRSSDNGRTWSGPTHAPAQQPLVLPAFQPPTGLVTDPDTGHLVETHPIFNSVAVDPNNGNLYAVWQDARFSNLQINAVAFSTSTDGGATWSAPMQVNQTPTSVPLLNQQAWIPTVQVAADGTVGVTYYDFRNNTPDAGCLTDYWLAYWRPGKGAVTNPANWSELRLTDSSFDIEQAPGRSIGDFGYCVGDYNGLASTGNGFAAVWTQPYAGASDQILFRRITFQGH